MVHNLKVLPQWAFYLLSLTWGLPLTLIGVIVIGALKLYSLVFNKSMTLKKHGYCYYLAIGHNWGGMEFGLFFLVDQSEDLHLRNHEFGHGVQNCYWGLLMLPVITIPSMIRYWYRELAYYRNGAIPPTRYDSIWFEGDASKTGYKYIEYLSK